MLEQFSKQKNDARSKRMRFVTNMLSVLTVLLYDLFVVKACLNYQINV